MLRILSLLCLCLLPLALSAQDDADDRNSRNEQPEIEISLRERQQLLFKEAYVPDNTRSLIAGDVLAMQIFEDEDPAHIIQINDEGYGDFPYVGRILVEGSTCLEVAELLKAKLETTYYYQATVFVGLEKPNRVRGHVYLIGEINKKGAMPIPANTEFTLSKAILTAGGFTDYADDEEVRIEREDESGQKRTITVDVAKIFEGDRSNDPILKPEDYVIVEKRSIVFK